jgi:hypothetical protein
MSDGHETVWGDAGLVTFVLDQTYTMNGEKRAISAPTSIVLIRENRDWPDSHRLNPGPRVTRRPPESARHPVVPYDPAAGRTLQETTRRAAQRVLLGQNLRTRTPGTLMPS